MTLEASHIQVTNSRTCSYIKNKVDKVTLRMKLQRRKNEKEKLKNFLYSVEVRADYLSDTLPV